MANKDAYLQVYQPLIIRKTLLNSALNCVKLLEYREKIIKIRKSKYVKIDQLKTLSNDIKNLVLKLEADLPEIKKQEADENKPVKSDVRIKQVKQPGYQFDDIEDEIRSIKEKIDNLNI